MIRCHDAPVRTTLQIDDDLLQVARAIARMEGRSLGSVISDLARRGVRAAGPSRSARGFPVFDVSKDAPPITPDMVRQANEDS